MTIKNTMGIIIGSKIKIMESKNKTLEGLNGRVVNQTKNTITLDTERGRKKIILSHVKIENEK
ncbi:ribonuclease P protein subunit [Candidatus Woesearchaeota archaeon]|nr:ribonuclease P protein subunit [Candidatus Woesearchaeota archaeon]